MKAPRLQVTSAADGQLALSGVIDEHGHLLDLLERSSERRLVLELAGVTFINSLGVRDWIRLLAQAVRTGIRLELTRVSEPLVQQFNMILATRTGVTVRSFFAPFACDPCGREDSICIEVEPNREILGRGRPPVVLCPGCGAAMSFNDFPERYFAFLAA